MTPPPSKPILVEVTTVASTLRAFFLDRIAYFKQAGYDVHAACSGVEELEEIKDRLDIPLHEVAMARAVSPWADLRTIRTLFRLFRRIRPTIVHTHTPKGGLLGTIASRLAGVPVVCYTVHGLAYPTRTGLLRRILKTTERISCRLAHQVYAVSPSLRQMLVAEGICPPDKIRVLGAGSIAGIDAGRFCRSAEILQQGDVLTRPMGIASGQRVLGFLGRFVGDKGIVELERAWRGLSKEFPDLHLLMLGRFETADPVDPDVRRRLEADGRVHILPWQWDVRPYLGQMSVLTLPTYREGFGVVNLEAGAMEVPVVTTTAVGAVDSVEHERTGLLVAPHDAAALEQACRRLLADEGLRRTMGQAARQRVIEQFDPPTLFREQIQDYQRLLTQRGLDSPAAR